MLGDQPPIRLGRRGGLFETLSSGWGGADAEDDLAALDALVARGLADPKRLGIVGLKVLGREVEYILYPDEHHEMKTTGRPDRRVDRLERIAGWFERYF